MEWTNLVNETIDVLKEYGRTPADVLYVSCGKTKTKTSWKRFVELVGDTEYYSGFGLSYVEETLMIVGTDFFMVRHDYDGSEWWVFIESPDNYIDGDVRIYNSGYSNPEIRRHGDDK